MYVNNVKIMYQKMEMIKSTRQNKEDLQIFKNNISVRSKSINLHTNYIGQSNKTLLSNNLYD